MSHIIRRLVLTALLLTFSAASALAEEWRVARVNPPASYSTDGTNWAPLKVNLPLPRKTWIKTGIRGRVQLRRGKETILLRANTTAKITHSGTSVKTTEIRQTFGRLLVDVETRKYKHTSVTTPYLAALVKGTKFDVYVGSGAAKVKVRRGVVEVSDTARGERVDVTNGQSVEVTRNSNFPMQVNGRGRKAAVIDIRTGKPVERIGINGTGDVRDFGGSGGVAGSIGSGSGGVGGSSNGGGSGGSGGVGGSVSGSVSDTVSGVSESVSDAVSGLTD